MREREEARVQWAEAEARSREAVQANAAKDEFLALLSHELRNPVAAITLSAETLARGADAARTGRAVASLSRQVGHLRRLVDDVLDLAAATHGKLAVHPRPVDLLQAACAAADGARERHSGVAFEPSGDPVVVDADPVRLEQMIGNLLDNAAKAQASIVHIRVSADQSRGVLEVTDNGKGITPEVMPRLFEAFYQGEPQGQARARGGLGLGLTLVNRLALVHGGALGAQSEGAGKGSTFSLRLPLATSAEAAVPPLRSASAGKLRIVIVEDEEDVREGLRAVLETEGHAVAAATDGVDGLALLLASAPDAALIDLGLPRMDGLELASRARAAGSNALLIAISGYAAQRDRHGTALAGFDLHLAKPVTGDDLKLALIRAAAKAA
jgi:CheY-like chemotaxis protein